MGQEGRCPQVDAGPRNETGLMPEPVPWGGPRSAEEAKKPV
jgi:hypothetical protein